MYRERLTNTKGQWVNFLAHSLFAQGHSERMAGQFAGDFVRGSDLSNFSDGIQLGIRMHRFIDHYTDHHPKAVAVRQIFQPPVRRFAGIVTDVVFDHYLALDWGKYSAVSLAEHVEHVHQALQAHRHQLPDRLQRFAAFIQREGVLESNITFNSVTLTLQRLSKRSARFAPIVEGGSVALANEAELKAVFDEFFPDLLAAADAHRSTLTVLG